MNEWIDVVLVASCCIQSALLMAIIGRVAYVNAHNTIVARMALMKIGGYGWCMCGDRIDDHGYNSNHNPVDMMDYYTEQMLIRHY